MIVRGTFKAIAAMLRDSNIKPGDVELTIHLRKRNRDKLAFTIGQEFENLKRIPGLPTPIDGGAFYGITFKLEPRE